jgi:hypothetical protein
MILPSSTKFRWQDAWMNEDIENSMDLASLYPFSKENSNGRVRLSLCYKGTRGDW